MSDSTTEIFRERLRIAREAKGLTQAELAELAKLPASSISLFEKGPRKPSFDNLRRLAGALDITTDYLLGRVDTLGTPQVLFRKDSGLDQNALRLLTELAKELGKKS
ncbi:MULTISPECIES: helix-turn-helix domain-containing protein [Desulfovibrio]|uniref:helix-turn-helix domain-containing protein n=1 Tax=Desulfovibrio TaxID=872 RepID=UPI00093008BA|nr:MULTISPECIES: helix-turn-helix transcriptional regulator [Desulfovibrio]ATD82414.1 XRE family transcriptional regulator [Desulfovibrio sp. G11]